ncbi:MAG: hypothetical protein ACKPBU_11305 [Alphaproteobacteria bacterium]
MSGLAWQECGERTTNSEVAPSRWALVYSTTPSLPFATSWNCSSTEMIEWYGTPGATGVVARPPRNGFPGVMLSTAVGTPSSSPPPPRRRFGPTVAIATVSEARLPGSFTSRRTSRFTIPPVRKLPRCGVEMNTSRFTEGSGSTNKPRRRRSFVAPETGTCSGGTLKIAFQSASPVRIAVILVSRPPWLCPMTTMSRRQGSRPSGSSCSIALRSFSRRSSAE